MEEEELKQAKDSAREFESISKLVASFKDGSIKDIIDDWKWIFTYSAKYKGPIIYYTVVGILGVFMGLVSSVVSKYLIDIVTGYKTEKLGMLIGLMLFSLVFNLVVGSIQSRFELKLGLFIGNDIQADIFDKIIDADWAEINKYPSGDIMNRFNSDVTTVSGNAISWLPTIIISIFNFVATFCLILYYDATMALIAFISAPFLLIMSRWFIKMQRFYNRKVREMDSKLMSFEVETFYNFDTIKSFGITKIFSSKLRWWQKKYRDISLEMNLFSIKAGILSSLCGTLVTATAFGYCLYQLWTRNITYGTMTLFLGQRAKLSNAFSSLISIIPGFINSSVAAHRIRELVDLPREIHLSESLELKKNVADGFTVKLEDVNFSYVADNQVLTDSNFVAKPGEIVALVGPSGEGKTTMIRMILGLIKPESGRAYLLDSQGNSVNMNADIRQYFSYVPQGNTLISGTIAENLRMVKEDATDEEVIEALKIACAYDFVTKLPEGINGNLGEKGRGVSEGQAQRIAIARAVLRDAPILLLDEATSALDVETERRVLRNIIQERPNKTCIVTTHRPSVLNLCQRVYRVMDTKVTELDEETSSKMVMDF